MSSLKVFCGYDPRQPLAFTVLAHSIWKRASKPVFIQQLNLSQLPITRRGLTEFTYSRFLAPYLSGYEGYSIFCDADMLCLDDITKLIGFVDDQHDVFVSKNKLKFEWASMMIFNNERCKILTPKFVEDTNNGLLDFKWARSIGEVPGEWNHLIGYDEPNPDAKLIHFTQGIPCFPETKGTEFSDEWNKELKKAISTVSWKDIMGNSVHAKPVYDRLEKQNT